jgi:ribosomal protein S6--L-glutamate ligase
MTLDIGIISVRGADYHPTRRLMEAAAQRRARVAVIHPYHMLPGLLNGRALLGPAEAAGPLDVVLPRQGAEIRTACLPLIAHFERSGIPVVNALAAIITVRHKYLALQALAAAGIPVPDTVYLAEAKYFGAALDRLPPGPVVVKPISGRQGTGIACLQPGQGLPEGSRAELDNGRGLLLQTFIAPERRQDIRALVVGDAVVGAMALTPRAGEFRANFHLGSRSRPVTLTPEAAALALGAARAVGLEIAGVDLMLLKDHGPLVVEVNYAPGFRGLEEATGLDAAAAIVDYAISRCQDHGPGGTSGE